MSFLARRIARRLGPVGVGLVLYDFWKRLPKKQRQKLIAKARKLGVRAAQLAQEKRQR